MKENLLEMIVAFLITVNVLGGCSTAERSDGIEAVNQECDSSQSIVKKMQGYWAMEDCIDDSLGMMISGTTVYDDGSAMPAKLYVAKKMIYDRDTFKIPPNGGYDEEYIVRFDYGGFSFVYYLLGFDGADTLVLMSAFTGQTVKYIRQGDGMIEDE